MLHNNYAILFVLLFKFVQSSDRQTEDKRQEYQLYIEHNRVVLENKVL